MVLAKSVIALTATISCSTYALCQVPDSFAKPTTPAISAIQRKSLEDLANDLPQLHHYQEQNRSLPSPATTPPRVVFFGDSLTEGWGMTARNKSVFFPQKPNYLNRGISGQTTLQMLVRFRQDVIDLHPSVVLLLAGTNDIAGNLGPASLKTITDNIQSMVQLAEANGIRVVLCSVLPATSYRWRPDLNPAPIIRQLNQWIQAYANSHSLIYVDYYTPLANDQGGMRDGLAWDGVHPQAEGYQIMAPFAEAAITAALAKPAP